MKAHFESRVKASKRQPAEQVLCPLPVEVINYTLEMELEAGDVVLTRGAQVHAERRHPNEFALCLPHLAAVIAGPLYVGDDHDNAGIELISRIAALGSFMLVAVNLERDAHGRYVVASFYPVSEQKIESRRQKGFLRVGQKPPEVKIA